MNTTGYILQTRLTSVGAALAVGLSALEILPNAFGQTRPIDEKKLDEIEKQIEVLKQAVDGLRRPSTAAQPTGASTASASANTNDPMARIRDEGLNRSQVMETLSYLTDVIGPRLTGSPNLKRANEWTRDKLASWGLTNTHLEAWGPFGRGWSLKRFSAQIIEPYAIPLIGQPKAWSPGFDTTFVGDVIYLDAKNESDLEKYKGKLKGAIVLTSPVRELRARFEPLATRMAETNLLRLANAPAPRTSGARGSPAPNPSAGGRGGIASAAGPRGTASSSSAEGASPSPNAGRAGGRSGRRGGSPSGQFNFAGRVLSFLATEEAALAVSLSSQGDGGTLFVSAASIPGAGGRGGGGPGSASRPSVWSTNAPPIPAQITLATEDYNRLVRMIRQGEKLKMAVDLRVQFHKDDPMAYNTIAEIPGSDLKDEFVMLGAHLDSWHSGTGATDNGAGVAATMEALRILQALKLQPRRTIRIGLWTGEEQGLLGSAAYVAEHFGYYTNVTSAPVETSSEAKSNRPTDEPAASGSRTTRKLVRRAEYEKLSAYFNLDNGTGKIRGAYMQGNEMVRPYFRQWLQPFSDLGAETLTLSNTGGTDHLSYDGIGLPGFQFIQDPIEYGSRTHHSNEDVFDRIQADDMKQASTILAAFVYQAAMLDEKLPRKPVE